MISKKNYYTFIYWKFFLYTYKFIMYQVPYVSISYCQLH